MYQSVCSALVHTVDQTHGARLEADVYLGGEDAKGSDSWPTGGCSQRPAPDPGSWLLSWLSGRVSSRQREQPVQRSWGWRKWGMFEGAETRKVRCHGPGVGRGSSPFFVLRAKRILWTFTQEAVAPLPTSRSGLHSEKILLRGPACSSVKWVSNCILHRGSGSNEPM